MFDKRRQDVPDESRNDSFKHISSLLGIPRDTIRGWVNRTRVDACEKPGVTTAERK